MVAKKSFSKKKSTLKKSGKTKKTKSEKSKKPKYDVITVGSSTIDVFADTESELIKIMTFQSEEDLIAYPVGTKIIINDLQFLTGGGGTNTAVSTSRLGLKTAYLGRMGKDENGDRIIAQLKKENIEFIGTRGNRSTGFSIVLDSIEDDRTILTFKGANDHFAFKDIVKSKLSAEWFYFCAMTGRAYGALNDLAKYAEQNKINIAFNPSNYLAEKGKKFLKPILTRTTLLVLNKEEAELLVGHDSVDELLLALANLGPKIVVITDGKNGAYALNTATGKRHFIKALKVKVKETTGAGDAFASSFMAGLILKKENDIDFALKLGIVNSASVVMFSGAKEKLLTWREAVSRINKQTFIIKHKKIA